jgi:hypothetical protein
MSRCSSGAANRDPRQWQNLDEYDVERKVLGPGSLTIMAGARTWRWVPGFPRWSPGFVRFAAAICSAITESNPTIVVGTGIGRSPNSSSTVVHVRPACDPLTGRVKRYRWTAFVADSCTPDVQQKLKRGEVPGFECIRTARNSNWARTPRVYCGYGSHRLR